jgi:hypothetical protein
MMTRYSAEKRVQKLEEKNTALEQKNEYLPADLSANPNNSGFPEN